MIYLDNAATSFPKPPAVVRAMAGVMAHIGANPGRSGHKLSLAAGRLVMQTRETLCQFFHADDPFSFIFCSNATDALNLAIHGTLTGGGHVVSSVLEHNSVLRPLHTLQQQGRITLTLLAPGASGQLSPQALEDALRADTRLVALTHASNVTGTVQDIEALGRVCRAHHVPFLVDAAQSAGIIPLPVNRIDADMIAMPGHKGLLGPQGMGVLFLRQGFRPEPVKQGGTGSRSDELLQPMELPERYESGTLNLPGIAGLGAGIGFLATRHTDIRERETRLTHALVEGLRGIDGVTVYGHQAHVPHVGVVSFNVRGEDSGVIADTLDSESNIAVRAGLHCAPLIHKHYGTLSQGAVRASLGFATTPQEIDALLCKVRALARR